MKTTVERVTIEESGLVRLSQDVLTRLKVGVCDYLNVEDAGYRCLHLTKAESPEEDVAVTLR